MERGIKEAAAAVGCLLFVCFSKKKKDEEDEEQVESQPDQPLDINSLCRLYV